ncbi:MAG: UvrD-helicase domain-containing protein, partial [Bacteroidales bacterium]|nr:UvrD-helicase domain-containing protein [Bacteroidales bacterium]
DFPEVLTFYQSFFQYVLVDEYQDTNKAQNLIVEQLVKGHRHLTVVGDDAQSIYSFRGANINNILKLEHHIPGTKLFKLEQNYRSTQNIVNAANSLISKNKAQIKKTIFSENDEGSQLTLTDSYSDYEEAYMVAEKISSLHDKEGYDFLDCAILYRTNAQSRLLEEALRKKGIDYRIFGGLSFYQRKEIKDVLAYLRLITNTADEEAFKRVINYPTRGIGDTTVGKLSAHRSDASLFELCKDPIVFGVDVNKGTESKLKAFAVLIEDFQAYNENHNAFELTEYVIRMSGILADFANKTSVEDRSRKENIEELLNAIQTFIKTCEEEGNPNDKLTDFLADVSLSGDVDPTEEDNGSADYVALMTIHQAKGLEFKNVFIVGLEENLIPSDMSILEPDGLEEERRLLYVAITRAEKNCFLSYARQRFRNGKSDHAKPSRFIKDIDSRFIKRDGSSRNTSINYGSIGGGLFEIPRT